jgi:hypothetical protein
MPFAVENEAVLLEIRDISKAGNPCELVSDIFSV